MLRTRVAAVLAAATVGSLALVSPAEADHSWAKYHWARSASPLSLTVAANVSGTWQPYLDTARAQWQSTGLLALTPATGTTDPLTCAPTGGRVEVCSAAYGANGWLGLASIWAARGGHITQATTKVNDYYFEMEPYKTPAWRAMVMCQEVGHDFGLGHVNEDFTDLNTGSCMDYTNDPSGLNGTNGPAANTAPNQHDTDQLGTIYAHLDAAGGGRKPGSSRALGNEPATWGVEVHRSADARVSVFERELGGGERVVTHVTWALDSDASTAAPHDHAEHNHAH